jgi:hypothetical protein
LDNTTDAFVCYQGFLNPVDGTLATG